MARGTLADRVENLENAVDSLRQVPARVGALEVRMSGVESQIVQLRHETRDGFSAMELRFEDVWIKQSLTARSFVVVGEGPVPSHRPLGR